MKTNTFYKRPLVLLAAAVLLHGVESVCSAQILVDSYLGGAAYSTAPFAGLTAVTGSWQDLGGVFVPSVNSQLTQVDVSIFAEAGAVGNARLTIFQYNQPPGEPTYVTIGPTLGYAEVPVGSYGPLVPFDFSSQSIQLQAGQTYAYMLSDPQSLTLSPAWRKEDFTSSGLDINSESGFTGAGFDYASVLVGASAHYEVFATPTPEPGSLTFGAAMLGMAALRSVWRRRRLS